LSGSDGIAVLPGSGNRRARLYVVVTENGSKLLWWFDAARGSNKPAGSIGLDTTGAVGVAAADGELPVLSIADKFELARVDLENDNLARSLPVQIIPRGLAVTPNGSWVVVANNGSGTLNVAPRTGVTQDPDAVYQDLEPYRQALLATFTDLVWRTLQALKDCACGHLLRDCPDMTYAPVPLALVTIRERKVYSICNFGCRQELVTFPKLGYWLSAVPVVQLVAAGVAEFCCLVLPALRQAKPGGQGPQPGLLVTQAIKGLVTEPTEFVQNLGRVTQGMKASAQSPLLASALQRVTPRLASLVTPGSISGFTFVGTDEKVVATELAKKGLVLNSVMPYSETPGRSVLADLAGGLAGIAPGDKVNVYTDAGKVVCVMRTEDDVAARGAAGTSEVKLLKENMALLQAELGRLKLEHVKTQEKAARGAADIAGLKAELKRLGKSVKPDPSGK
jgi:hypothetical protein